MPNIILIETSTSLCTTALIRDEKIVCARESSEARSQAAMTAPFVKEMLDEAGIAISDCDAVCVSAGPGSYTGLRVGVSTAKGLCFASGIPLISVNTLELLVNQAVSQGLVPEGCKHIIPMIDARRMEVYAAVFSRDEDGSFVQSGEISPVVVDAGSFSKEREEGKVLFIGDGAGKCSGILAGEGCVFVQTNPRAEAMLKPALKAYKEKRFESTAYFEPFYLKQFVATVSRKNLL